MSDVASKYPRVRLGDRVKVHSVNAGGGEEDGSLWGMFTFCGKQLGQEFGREVWVEVGRDEWVTCGTCIKAAIRGGDYQ